jgi:hypothetical protein
MARGRKPKPGSWVQRVRETSDAMDLPPGIFKRSSRAIARGLEQSVQRSRRTKATKFQSCAGPSAAGPGAARRGRPRSPLSET